MEGYLRAAGQGEMTVSIRTPDPRSFEARGSLREWPGRPQGPAGGAGLRVLWTPVSTPRPSSSAPFCDEWRRDRILPKRWLAGQVSPEGKSPVTHSLTPRCEHPVPAPLLETVGETNPNRPRGWEVPARGSGSRP